MAMAGFKVFRGSKHVDTVFYTSSHTPEEVRESLVRRGEFPSTIKVRRERKPNGYGVSGTAKTKRMKAVRNPKRKLLASLSSRLKK